MKQLILALALCFGVSTVFAQGDSVRLGGSRAASMGGAGLALPYDVGQNHNLNPAMLGLRRSGFGFGSPSIGVFSRGFSFKRIQDTLGDVNSKGGNTDEATKIARELGGKPFDVGADLSLGLVFGNVALSAGGEAIIASRPNRALRDYIANNPNGDFTGLSNGERLDAYGFAYHQVSFSGGSAVQTKRGNLYLGAKLKRVTGFYSHQFADEDAIENESDVRQAPEMRGEDVLSKSALGLDFGALYKLPTSEDVFVGLRIDNLLKPNVKFDRTDGAGLPMDQVNPFRTTTSVGIGTKSESGALLALDIHDFFGNGGGRELRLGAEVPVGRMFAVRAGYNSRYALSVGVSVGGLNIGIGGRAPLTLSSSVSF